MKIIGTYQKHIKLLEKEGRVTSLTPKETTELDMKIMEAFSNIKLKDVIVKKYYKI